MLKRLKIYTYCFDFCTISRKSVDYTILWSNNGWKKAADGYWYHANAVEPGGITSVLVERAEAVSAPEGYKLNVQIIATAVQSMPDTAVKEAWGITPVDGKLNPN